MYFYLFFIILLFSLQCNNPHLNNNQNLQVYYDTFTSEPKHLDPAIAYSSNEYTILTQIYEPPLQYHFLKRPYELIPLSAKEMPTIKKSKNKVIYRISLRKDLQYEPHPAFSKNKDGTYKYHLNNSILFKQKHLSHPKELTHDIKDTRNVYAQDFIYQIKRMADPKINSPIKSVLEKYIIGFTELSKKIQKRIEDIRKDREKNITLYNQHTNEKEDPIYLDLRQFKVPGLKMIDSFTYEIHLKQAYPQFIYWLAMPFFAPMPWEAIKFYDQRASIEENFSLDKFPIGSGAFALTQNESHYQMVLTKNPHFHSEYYPNEGEETDKQQGLLLDKNKELPFIDKAIYVLEKESIPRWNKFLQGYYDASGIDSEIFDNSIQVNNNHMELTSELKEKNINLEMATQQTILYYSFNMLDNMVGGYTEKKKKLRQAIGIAIDVEEYIQIFLNGRGVLAHSLIPPGIFGYEKEDYNFIFYNNKNKKKDIEYAKKLLREAGFPNGLTPEGKRLVLYFDTYTGSGSFRSEMSWLRKQFSKLNIDLQIRATDYNQFRRKVSQGNYQILRWGWHADYPDPENFLFLLYGLNAEVKYKGPNHSNYDNPQFNILFEKMANMENNNERLNIIRKMLKVFREDTPWVCSFYPVSYVLFHNWYQNTKPMTIGNNTLKYRKVVPNLRQKYQKKENSSPWNYILIIISICLSLVLIGKFIIKSRLLKNHESNL